jgi:hypothetical protein
MHDHRIVAGDWSLKVQGVFDFAPCIREFRDYLLSKLVTQHQFQLPLWGKRVLRVARR